MFKTLALFSCLATVQIAMSSESCDISGLDKVVVVRALWKEAKVESAFLFFMPQLEKVTEISDESIKEALNADYIDYLQHKFIGASFSQNSFGTHFYNRKNGEGAAEKIVDGLRNKK